MSHPQVSNEELGRRGQEIYEQQIRAKLDNKDQGKILAIDVETGDYEIDDDVLTAVHRAQAKHPGAPIFTMRIGSSGVYSFGGPRHGKQ